MDERHFGFRSEPFSLTLDPAFFFRSRQHIMAETVLEYALESEAAFCLLSGEIGCGKSLLVSRLLSKLGDGIKVGLINHTHGRLRSIHGPVAFALGIERGADSDTEIYETLVTSFRREYATGRRTLLIVDEAQNLSVEILEELRLLSNANSKKNYLQIFLVGQPELRARLCRPELRQFAQRISAQSHLSALERDETHSYIRHRLHVAGGNPSLFTSDAMDLVHARTQGVPRLINQLCHFALAQASAADRVQVYADMMVQMPRDFWGGLALQSDLQADRRPPNQEPVESSARPLGIRRVLRLPLAAAAVLALALAGASWWQLHKPQKTYDSISSAVAMKNSEVVQSAHTSMPVTAAVAAPAAATVALPTVVPDTASVNAAPSASQNGHAASLSQGEPSVIQAATTSARAVRPSWYVNRASERLNAGDTAGAERLMQQASAAGAEPQDVADLRAAVDAQKLELHLISAADQIKAAIASDALLDPATDNAETRYREMLTLSSTDPLTLRAQRELHVALLVHAEDAIHKDQFDAARRFLAAAANIGPSAAVATAQEQLRGELNRVALQATTAASDSTAPVVNGTTGK